MRAAAALLPEKGESGEESKRLLERATALAPDDPWTLTRCASQLWYLADNESSAEWFDRSWELVRRAERLAPDDFDSAADLVHVAGVLAFLEDDDDLAERALVAAFEASPEAWGTAEARPVFRRPWSAA